jgi:uncharacterized protein YutE (UPF0331/DUF86 family)
MEDLQNQVIRELIQLVETEISLLEEKKIISLENYLKDWDLQHIVERAFQKAIQGCIDIGARIVSKKSYRKATDYHDIFNILFEKNIISESLRKKLSEMVGFRNVLVHEYRVIDNKEVYRHLQENLDIFRDFISIVLKIRI